MRGIFVTGTDTGIGKTVVSSLVVSALRPHGPVGYWKPVQTGIEQDDDTAEVRRLAGCSDEEIHDEGIRLPRPLSPHLSARLAGRSIAMRDIAEVALRLATGRLWVVEGAGGVLVPLNPAETMGDLIAALGIPAIVTARSSLGTINHTLLTLAELRRRAVGVAGVVMVGHPDSDNREAIEHYGGTKVLAEVPFLDPLAPEPVARLASGLSPAFRRLAR